VIAYSIDMHFFRMHNEWCMTCTKPDGEKTGLIPLTAEQVDCLKKFTDVLDIDIEKENGHG